MLYYTIEILEKWKDGKYYWENLDGVIFPFYDTTTLDDSLDYGSIKLSMSSRKEDIKPFTRLRITSLGHPGLEIHRIVGSSKKTMRRFAPTDKELYSFDIETLELTKLLEREPCDTMTVTHYLGRGYKESVPGDYYNSTYEDSISKIELKLLTPLLENTKKIGSTIQVPIHSLVCKYGEIIGTAYRPAKVKMEDPSGRITLFNEGKYYPATDFNEHDFPKLFVTLSEVGVYMFTIEYLYSNRTIATLTHSIGVFDEGTSSEDWTITRVVNRLLSVGVTRRVGIEKQKYVFDATQALEFSSMKSPEFFFARATLFESLLQVGEYIHAIPRLEAQGANGETLVVRFDKLGGNEIVEVDTLPPETHKSVAIIIDDYCGAIDTTVENLLNTRDRRQGAIASPDDYTYKTVRCEENTVEISADTMIISTEFPIYQIIKVECGYIGKTIVGDITPYVYEEAEYSTLSSYWGSSYPYSKAYALRYKQGDSKITGLNFKIEKATSLETAFKHPAIVNIIESASGIKLKTGFVKLAFRVTYIPMVTTRIVQMKSTLGYPQDNTLIYNQGANTVESELLGEKMKGTIARLGQNVVQKTFIFGGGYAWNRIPKCGQILDGMYVAVVECEYNRLYIKATLTLTPNFNKIAEHLAIDSNVRMFDISEKQSVERYINYGEKLIIGDDTLVDGVETVGQEPIGVHYRTVANILLQKSDEMYHISKVGAMCVFLWDTRSGKKKQIERIALPCLSFASGNSLCFATKFYDNFGAGFQSSDFYDNDNEKKVQRLVKYTNNLGNVDTIDIQIGNSFWMHQQSSQTAKEGHSNMFPQYSHSTAQQMDDGQGASSDIRFREEGWTSVDDHALIIDKDSRESLNIMYQLHFVANRKSIVIGSRLGQNNPLVTICNENKKAKLYFLPYTLNALNAVIDVSGLVPSKIDVSDIATYKSSTIGAKPQLDGIVNDSGKSAKAWVMIDPTNNMPYIGENVELGVGQKAPKIVFSTADNSTEL